MLTEVLGIEYCLFNGVLEKLTGRKLRLYCGSNLDLFAGLRVDAHASSPLYRLKGAESGYSYLFTASEALGDGVKEPVDDLLSLFLGREVCVLVERFYQIILFHIVLRKVIFIIDLYRGSIHYSPKGNKASWGDGLSGVFNRTHLSDDVHLDLARVFQLSLNLAGDVFGHRKSAEVINLLRNDKDTNFAAG